MEFAPDKMVNKLIAHLEELTKNYRSLLEVVRKEKECLLSADIEVLNECNKQKDLVLYRLRQIDNHRDRTARELANMIGADAQHPRLLELAQKLGGESGEKLRVIHSTLDLLIKRISELNKENEQYAQSALQHLNGAIEEVKDSLSGKGGYAKQGKVVRGPEVTGNLVRKEV